ncbi:MAG: LysR substrate-binding domain-containing protein, partial [Methyloligellaceae bacterium]
MSIRRLKTLIAIAEKGSFAGASEVVHVSQAAVSQQMKSLEEELQVVLFDRSKRPPELNQQGLALTAKAREVVHSYDAMLQSLFGDGALRGQLMLGAVPTTLSGLVPRTVSALKMIYPDLGIRIIPGLSAELMPQVDRSYLDAAIISEPRYIPNHMNWQPFAAEPLVLLAPFRAPSDDPLELLATYPYIRFTRRAWVGSLIDQWLEANQIGVNEAMELDTLESVSANVFHNLGVSIVPFRSVPSPHPLPVKRIPLRPTAKSRILGVISRQDCVSYRMIEVLVKELT